MLREVLGEILEYTYKAFAATDYEAARHIEPVEEVAVVPAPDPERGSVVRAVIVVSEGVSREGLAEELQSFCQEKTAPYKYPRIVDFVESLPRTPTGKVARSELRKPGA